MLEPDAARRGAPSSRSPVGSFELRAQAVVIATDQGVRLVNRDQMWHRTEGLQNWDPVWPDHAIRILPGPSSVWLDARGRQLPAPGLPGYDALGTLELLRATPDISEYDYSWFILDQSLIKKEFALSGSEQNLDIANRDLKLLLKSRLGSGVPGPMQDFMDHGEDFVVADTLPELVEGMSALTGEDLLELTEVEDIPRARDHEMTNPYSKDAQAMGIRNSRRYLGDKITRIAKPHRILDPAHGPLIAVRRWIVTRKTLGGIQTDLSGRAMRADGSPSPALRGRGGSGLRRRRRPRYNALEGTFLGACLFTGRTVGRSLAKAL